MKREHYWQFCDHCECDVVICGTCRNNCCNGGYGEIIVDGQKVKCPDCKSAYDKQDSPITTTIRSANGITGCLLLGGTTPIFRVYDYENQTFADYDILHSDLFVTINDEDAELYIGKYNAIDHSRETLGIK